MYIKINYFAELKSPTQTAPIDTPSQTAQVTAQDASLNISSPAQFSNTLPLHDAAGLGSPPTAVGAGAAAASPSADSVCSDYSASVLLEKESVESVSSASGSSSLYGKLFFTTRIRRMREGISVCLSVPNRGWGGRRGTPSPSHDTSIHWSLALSWGAPPSPSHNTSTGPRSLPRGTLARSGRDTPCLSQVPGQDGGGVPLIQVRSQVRTG